SAGEVLVSLETVNEEADGAPASPRVEFATVADDDEREWWRICTSVSALFSGYDAPADPSRAFERALALAERHADYRDRLFDLIYAALEMSVTIDTVFSGERISAEQFARPVSWQELIYIYFRYAMHGNETMPSQFVAALEAALVRYPRGLEREGSWDAFYHMQRTQRERDRRLELMRTMIFTVEGMSVPAGRSDGLLRLLDEVVRLHQIAAPSLADAALHARYHLYEQSAIRTVRHERTEWLREQLAKLGGLPDGSNERRTIEQGIVDSSPSIVYELLDAWNRADGGQRGLARSLIARHLVRDREIELSRTVSSGGHDVSVVRADGMETAVIVCESPVGGLDAIVSDVAADPSVRTDGMEVIVIHTTGDEAAEASAADEALFAHYASTPLDVEMLCVGVYRGRARNDFRSYRRVDGWQEDERRRHFSPLFYRELRVHRLDNFEYRVVYRSDAVFLIAATARDNPRDERLFALATASESAPELGRGGQIERVSEFDEVFMEAAFKMRSEQAHRRRRLFWNRIIVHIRALIPLSASQIKEYGTRIVPRTRELGLEKLVVYTRRKRWSEDVVRELELLFLNISEDQFTLRSRKPSDEPYKPMDRYVSSVVRSRQRNNVYPYEVVKMITYTGYPVSLNVPRGDFEEYDIEIDGGTQRATSVKGRPYGHNDSNVVLGIVRNQDPASGLSYRRVLVLSDATRDMGSLAEDECRRVIAALDLADAEGIPVEWIPISSGARIDMESGTENLDWTAAVLRRIVEFTQGGGEINIIVSGINVGAQSYWNAEATMLMHTRGLLIMTDDASMLLTGKKALDFSGSVSADSNVDIGGVERIMGPNGQAQLWVPNLAEAYRVLFQHYRYTYVAPGEKAPRRIETADASDRDVGATPYEDRFGQGFATIGDIFSERLNPERKKPFDMRQLMRAVVDDDAGYLERWSIMKDAETAITWETRVGGYGVGLVGIESRPL
ncbi:MAG: carboxyl transferase domain-containing protein, partial [Spirochaetota bacterium]